MGLGRLLFCRQPLFGVDLVERGVVGVVVCCNAVFGVVQPQKFVDFVCLGIDGWRIDFLPSSFGDQSVSEHWQSCRFFSKLSTLYVEGCFANVESKTLGNRMRRERVSGGLSAVCGFGNRKCDARPSDFFGSFRRTGFGRISSFFDAFVDVVEKRASFLQMQRRGRTPSRRNFFAVCVAGRACDGMF